MDLALVWFVLIAVLWTGYLVLEGFDFGVGMLLGVLPRADGTGRKDTERRLLINTIGPVWDGNEVWLITAAGATFAAFPEWYATLFSGFYLPLLAILVALIVRAVAFEYRGKIDDAAWTRRADLAIQFGSWVPAFLWGLTFANLVRGVPLDAGHQYAGTLADLFSPFAVAGAVVVTLLCLLHGAIFVSLKTDGDIRARARRLAAGLAWAALPVAGGWAVWAQLAYSVTWTWAVVGVAAAGLAGVVVTTGRSREGRAFGLSALVLVAYVVLVFGSMYPDVLPGAGGGESLTIAEAASTPYTLGILTVVAAILTPLVIAYQAWTYWVFRRRLSVRDIPPPIGLTWQRIKDAAF
ncbi:cytochrome d ubiquinol oxidase subunit II [Myceligenerans crystallogenes]|uniref:Cytochrome d ubiquinol oxidase subunit II n=1 Tax=Myceligenerans crystallogenes TaxID=316335 RepID=A0ABN2NIP1_9MICO